MSFYNANSDSMSERSSGALKRDHQYPESKVRTEEEESWPKMFSASSPSPTRCMIKEANEHLQLLHQRVLELERTVQEQAEALIKKDETMQTRIREVIELKDAKIVELDHELDVCQQRVLTLEQLCQEKDAQIEQLSQRNANFEELESYVPVLEKLASSLKRGPPYRAPAQPHHHHRHNQLVTNNVNNVDSIGRMRKLARSSSLNARTDRSSCNHPVNSIDGRHYHAQSRTQMESGSATNDQRPSANVPSMCAAGPVSELRIGRSFNINSNFSMSEDDEDEDTQ